MEKRTPHLVTYDQMEKGALKIHLLLHLMVGRHLMLKTLQAI
jgi:hypothetical protein